MTEDSYLAHHQLRSVFPTLVRARDAKPDNHKLAAAAKARFTCLRATDDALDDEREAAEVLRTFTESRDAMYKVRTVVNNKKARA